MSDGYKLKIHTHNPEAVSKLVGGSGLLNILDDTISNLSKKFANQPFMPIDSPFFSLKKSDFDIEDDIVRNFFDNGGLNHVKAIILSNDKNSIVKLSEINANLQNIRLANLRTNLRVAYNAIQNALNKNNEAVKLERLASKLHEKSSGYWQIESLKSLDNSLKYADISNSETIKISRKLILEGEREYLQTASELIKAAFENITPKSNTRLAYTTLSTQDNEAFLLCPKGMYVGKNAVPMEVSKCRENCIDSRVAKDGSVTCAYQDWLKVAFEPQNRVLNRLDVHKHPDNEQNINLAEGERSKKLTEGEFGYEFRLDHSSQGANKLRNSDKNYYSESREKQLSEMKTSELGHSRDKEIVKAPKQAQSDSKKVIDNQLEPQRKNQSGNEFLEALLRKLNKTEINTEQTREEQLIDDGLQAHRGEAETSFSEQLNSKKEKKQNFYINELNKSESNPTESISNILNKTANKQMTQEQLLEEPRQQSKGEKSREEELMDRRTRKNMSDEAIESLLENEDEWEYTDEEFEGFMKDLGLDSKLENSRNIYKLDK